VGSIDFGQCHTNFPGAIRVTQYAVSDDPRNGRLLQAGALDPDVCIDRQGIRRGDFRSSPANVYGVRRFSKNTATLVDSADCDWDVGGDATALAAENLASILAVTWSVRADATDPC
jgi:hypothetical protein